MATEDQATTEMDGASQTEQAHDDGPRPTTTAKPTDPVDDLVTTEHTLKVGRRGSLKYTATTGRIVLREEVYDDGVFKGHAAKATMFVTSYVAKDEGPNRPVTFAFNGGPGSSSVWLHLGLLGPRRVLSGDVGELAPPPYGMATNTESLLAVSDLVFIDPVSTGFSRAVEGGKSKDFHGYTPDIESVGELIRLWTTRNDRWLSPKFLIGESYGTTRAAALAEHLQERRGLYLNGIVLVSSVLDFSTIGLHGLDDAAAVNFLPTYAATAWYHGKHGRKALKTVLDEAETFCDRQYPWLLARGSRLSSAERAEGIATIARLTGLSEAYVELADLRIEHMHFFTELLRDQHKIVGRLDTRFTGPAGFGNAEIFDADASSDLVTGAYAAAWNHYVRADLGYETDLPYEISSERAFRDWSYKEFEGKSVSSAEKLARAMRMNPSLKVQVSNGYLDGATPYYAAQDVFSHLQIPADLAAANIEHKFYDAGHMMYVHEPSRLQQSADIADFVTRNS